MIILKKIFIFILCFQLLILNVLYSADQRTVDKITTDLNQIKAGDLTLSMDDKGKYNKDTIKVIQAMIIEIELGSDKKKLVEKYGHRQKVD